MLIEDGSASTPGLSFASDTNSGLFGGSDTIGFATGCAERLEIGSSEVVFNDPSNNVDFRVESNSETHMLFVDAGNDRIGITESSPSSLLSLGTSLSDFKLKLYDAGNADDYGFGVQAGVLHYHSGGAHVFEKGGSEKARIDSSGRLMLGTTTEGNASADNLTIADSGNCGITIRSGTNSFGEIYFSDATSGGGEYDGFIAYNHPNRYMQFATGQAERMRLDISGRLLVGTTSAIASGTEKVQIKGDSLSLYNATSSAAGAGRSINFRTDGGATGAMKASISGENDGSYSYGGRLVFKTSTTSNDTQVERMRITGSGDIHIGRTNNTRTTTGYSFESSFGVFGVTSNTTRAIDVNRQGNDGDLILFFQANSQEGSISVSGTTVSYNGAHLSRWSQLAGGAERTEILRGSVLSNLDEMCEWGEEDNEQLNRMKVSDVEGDVNVAGVFQDWDDDDDTYTNDFHCAMTGDFVIRIAQGTTVARGDLLMSAGDGTAKPQDDDIVRSKTIAKVTSTTVSTTYSDGSYCVPCVLMAC